MHIKITYAGRTVGVYHENDMFMQPLFTKVADKNAPRLLRRISEGEHVVYEDWDGHLIEFEKVLLWG